MEDCPFCAIAEDRLPAEVVLRRPGVVAFLDARPVFPGHVLVVPREHHVTLTDLPDALVPVVFGAAQAVAACLPRALGCDGTFVAVNNRVSQSVGHLHVHVVPRRFKDGLRGFFWPRQPYADEAHRARVAASVRAALQDP